MIESRVGVVYIAGSPPKDEVPHQPIAADTGRSGSLPTGGGDWPGSGIQYSGWLGPQPGRGGSATGVPGFSFLPEWSK